MVCPVFVDYCIGTVGRVEKSKIFPPFPQQNSDGDDEEKRIINIAVIIENPVVQKKTSTVTRERRIVYNQAAAGKEWHSKQGSTATCSCLTK